MSLRPWFIKVIVPIIAFFVGAVFPILFDRITKEVTELQVTLLVILIFSLALIALTTTYSILFEQSRDDQAKIDSGQINILDDMQSGRADILNEVKKLADQFGLLVEYIEESSGDEGITYERTTKLIEESEESLVFLDAWVQTTRYSFETDVAKKSRQAYYDAIIKQIEKYGQTGNHFHRRIIQMPGDRTDVNHFVLIAGSVFSNYVKKILTIHRNDPGTCVIKLANMFIHASFVIIDQRYIVWPILTYSSGGTGLQRHGAMIFTDPRQVLVPHLMAIYDMIDGNARPLEPHHLGIDAKDL